MSQESAERLRLDQTEPVVQAVVAAIHSGDEDALRGLLERRPGHGGAVPLRKGGSRTALHVVTDWPGFFPNGPAIVAQLIAAGADPNAPVEGSWHAETALHWAASSDDVEVARALIDAGADIEAPGASIAGGAPLDAAIGYGCWRVARLLVERGARVGKLWQAAALAMTSRVEELLSSAPATRQDLTDVLASVSRRSPPDRGAPPLSWGGLNGTPSWDETTPLDAADSIDTGTQALVDWLREQGARSLKQTS